MLEWAYAYIDDAIGSKAITAVTPQDIAAMDRFHRKELSQKSADMILGEASHLFQRLVDLEQITRNPVKVYQRITPAAARQQKPAREGVAVDPGIARRMIRAMDDDPYQTAILWLLLTGMRIGELRGLRWVNVRDGAIHIVEQRLRDGTIGPLKTKKVLGEGRAIPLAGVLLTMTPRADDAMYVLPDGWNSYDAITDHFQKCMTAADPPLPIIRLHDLRHTFATGLLNLGCEERVVAAMLGHKHPTMTAKYTHPSAEAMRPWVERWATLLTGEQGQLRRIGS